jgi:Tfp pilus assembly protein PilV
MSGRRAGFSVVEALVAAALAGVALAGLSTVAGLARRSLLLARETSVALALASERLESLRVGPRADGADAPSAADGTTFSRRWTVEDGRGGPTRLRVEVRWGAHAVALASEVPP